MKLTCTFIIFCLFQGRPPFENKHTFPGNCEVSGTTKVDATVLFFPYRKDFQTTYQLKIRVNQTSRQTILDITHKGHTSTLQGTLVNDNLIELLPNQSIPQNFEGDGFVAELTGTLKKGMLITIKKQTRMYLNLDVNGTISSKGISADAKGKVETDAYSK